MINYRARIDTVNIFPFFHLSEPRGLSFHLPAAQRYKLLIMYRVNDSQKSWTTTKNEK